MNILISGGTGFIGRELTNKLIKKGHHIYIVTRNPHKYRSSENKTYIDYYFPIKRLPRINAVINLAGETLYGRWTDRKKRTILKSRLETTRKTIDIMKKLNEKPEVFISASAVGFYGMSEHISFTEDYTKSGDDFLAKVTAEWETVANEAKRMNIRTVNARFGIVLDKSNGALPLMTIPVKLFVGGKIGNGQQWMSWIHINDCVNLLLFALENKAIVGPLNVTAPFPKRNRDFIKLIASTLNRPSFFPTPASMLKIILGEMSSLIIHGQYVYPQKAINNGFTYEFPYLENALKDIFIK